MIRTTIIVCTLLLAVLFLPIWLQLALFLIAVWVSPHRVLILIPAVCSDVIYNPSGHLGFTTMTLTVVVGVFILIRWLLLTQTRFAEVFYGMEA